MEKELSWQNFLLEDFISDDNLVGLNADVRAQIKQKLDGLALKLSADVLKEDVTNRRISTNRMMTFEHPRSPWQYFKMGNSTKWWMSWYVKIFPVKYFRHKHEVSCFHSINPMLLFPEQVMVPRQYGRAVRYVQIDEGEFRVYNQAADYRQTR